MVTANYVVNVGFFEQCWTKGLLGQGKAYA